MPSPITVSSLAELHLALSQAQSGQTILLNGGRYDGFYLNGKTEYDTVFPQSVTIASANPEDPAIFSRIDLRGAANLTFDGLVFDYTFKADDAIWHRPFSISSSSGITIRNSVFDGDLASGVSEASDGYGYGIGLSIRNASDVTVENNEMFDFHRGMTTSQSDGVTVRGNEVHSIRSDGLNFAEVSGVLIENNHIHDFRASAASGDHRDMIQFWTNGTDSPSSDITIRGNRLDIGEGSATQSIFMRNEEVDKGRAETEMFYRDILIEDNVITNAHMHGIALGATSGLTIRSNSVLHADGEEADGRDSTVEIPRISVSARSSGVTIANNATFDIKGWSDQPDWTVQDNALVQDQNSKAAGYYNDVFLSSSLTPVDGLHDFRALEGGLLDMLDAGAGVTLEGVADPGLQAAFQMTRQEGNGALHRFDAGATTADRAAPPEDATYHWDFGDGTTATGLRADHAFLKGGRYEVSLTVQLTDGGSDTSRLTLDVQGPRVVSYTPDGGFLAYERGEEIALPGSRDDTAQGIDLGQPGVAASIPRGHVTDLFGQDEFRISMNLAADTADSAGEVLRLHGSFIASVTGKGEMFFRAFTADGGETRLVTSGARLDDMSRHDIDISLNDDILSISVDGDILASTGMTGDLGAAGNHALTFGNPWDRDNFDATLSAFEILVDEGDFAVPKAAGGGADEAEDDTFLFRPPVGPDPILLEIPVILAPAEQMSIHPGPDTSSFLLHEDAPGVGDAPETAEAAHFPDMF